LVFPVDNLGSCSDRADHLARSSAVGIIVCPDGRAGEGSRNRNEFSTHGRVDACTGGRDNILLNVCDRCSLRC
jgi:hypothetical protein